MAETARHVVKHACMRAPIVGGLGLFDTSRSVIRHGLSERRLVGHRPCGHVLFQILSPLLARKSAGRVTRRPSCHQTVLRAPTERYTPLNGKDLKQVKMEVGELSNLSGGP